MNRLLSVNSYHYRRGGSDAVYLDHAALFERRGWENIFFSMQHPKNQKYAFEHLFASRIDYGLATSVAQNLRNASSIIYSTDARRRLSDLLDSHPVDIAHFHIIHHHLSPSVLMEARRRGIPTVMTAHDLKLACPSYKMMNDLGVCERCKGGRVWNVLRHRCIKGSSAASGLVMVESAIHKLTGVYRKYLSAVVAPSRFYREKLIEWGWDRNQVHYIPNFVSMEVLDSPAPYGEHVLYFGRLAPEKGVATLVRASAKTHVPLVIVGEGPEENKLQALAGELNAPVIFKGFLSGQPLRNEIDVCRAVVLPSEWYENAPVSVLEAFARGRPVAGAAIGGIPELINIGQSGWHFPSGDVDALSAVLLSIKASTDLALATMGHAGSSFVKSTFSEERYYKDMIKLYAEISSSSARQNQVGLVEAHSLVEA